MKLKLACGLVLLMAACVEEPVVGSVGQEAGGSCGVNETAGDRGNAFFYNGTVTPWNPQGRLVYDYRKCNQSNDAGDEIDGAIVAHSLNASVPSFSPVNGSTPNGGYRVYAPAPGSYTNHKLLIYLQGSNADNDGKDQLLQRAAYLGYHVVGVRYWNGDDSSIGKCGDGPAAVTATFGPVTASNPYTNGTSPTYDECIHRLRRNQWENTTPDFVPEHLATPTGSLLTAGDAARYRVRKLLTYLDQRHPNGGWGDYVSASGDFDWAHIAVMGHSTGSKVFFALAHDQPGIDRVILLSGPNLPFTQAGLAPAGLSSDINTPGQVPLNRIYAFSDTHDPNEGLAAWAWLYMSGPNGTVGLRGQSAGVPLDVKRTCTGAACLPCGESKPLAPTDTAVRSMTYSGNTKRCTGQAAATDPIDGDWAHAATTSDSSCAGGTPDTCWYLNIWDYMLSNQP